MTSGYFNRRMISLLGVGVGSFIAAAASAGSGQSDQLRVFMIDLAGYQNTDQQISVQTSENQISAAFSQLFSGIAVDQGTGFARLVVWSDTDLPAFASVPSTMGSINSSTRSQAGAQGRSKVAREDNLNLVPLPSAAFAGLGMLAGIAGVRFMRKHH